MEYVYSAMLLHSAGKDISEENLTKVLEAAGVTPDAAKVKALTASLEGVNIEEAIATPAQMAAVAAQPQGPGGAPPAKEDKKEKKDDKEDEASEEDAAAGLGALFG